MRRMYPYSLAENAFGGECRCAPGIHNLTNWALAWTLRKAVLLPQPVPLPAAVGGCVRQAKTKLVREHDDLAAVMRFVGEHVTKHRRTSRPRACPTAAREFCDATRRPAGQSVCKH